MSVAPPVYLDTNVLWSFASVGRLDLLNLRFGDRIRWTDAVSDEVLRNSRRVSFLSDIHKANFMPDPVSMPLAELGRVLLVRSALASVNDPPSMHMGEAETIHVIATHDQGAVFLTDDVAASHLAGRRYIRTMRTAEVLSESYAMGEIGCPAAYNLLVDMRSRGRGVRVPADHTMVC